jgi:Cu/Ag efflux protein CusF
VSSGTKEEEQMRKLILAVVLTSAASWAVAQEPAPPAQQPAPPGQQPAQTAKDTKEMTATVVNTDPTVKTITIKKDTGVSGGTMPEQTLSVDDKALANLKTIKMGDKVKLVLKTDPATGKESVTSIEKPKSTTQEPR